MSKNLHESITPKSIVIDYLSGIGYTHAHNTQSSQLQQRLEQDITKEIESWDIPKDESDDNKYIHKLLRALIRPSCAIGAMAYPNHDYSVQLLISQLTFFTFYVDDRSSPSKCPNLSSLRPFLEFQQRFTHSPPQLQLDPILDRFASSLREVYKHWDPISANTIVTAILEFINGSCIENVTEAQCSDISDGQRVDKGDKIQTHVDDKGENESKSVWMKINPNAVDYPDFLRSKTGATQAFAFFIFPKIRSSSSLDVANGYPNLKGFIQAIPSIAKWANLTNDIISFHKEELAGETANFIHLKSKVTERRDSKGNDTSQGDSDINRASLHVLRVAKELVKEALKTAERVERILDEDELQAWLDFKTGFIRFHVSQERYKILELLESIDSRVDAPA